MSSPSSSLLLLVAVVILALGCAEAADPPDAPRAALLACGAPDDILTVRHETTLGGCEWARGSVHVPDWNADSLPFERLRRVDGDLAFFRPHHLRDFRGLERLETVGAEFSIRLDNAGELVALDGLEALREVGGLEIHHNVGLADIGGLSGLETVHGDLTIEGNTALPSSQIDALLARIRVTGTTTVMSNEE